MRLGDRAAALGYGLERFGEVGSTNDIALAAAQAGRDAPTWHVAQSQTGGKGRQGRLWRSPPGNLYASLSLVDPCDLSVAPQLGFVAGVALAAAVRGLLGAASPVALKWPNDLLYESAKLSGMLLESARLPDGRAVVAVGIGVNVASHPEGLGYETISIAAIKPAAASVDGLMANLSDAFAQYSALWDRGRNFPAIREEWLRHCGGLGKPVVVRLGAQTQEGLFETIDPAGRLLLRTQTGLNAIEAGDVWLAGGGR